MTVSANPKHLLDDESRRNDRRNDLQVLVARINAYGVPNTWNVNVAGSSMSVISPKRTMAIKTDVYHTVTFDLIKGGVVKSEVTKHTNVNAAWVTTEKLLNQVLKREPCQA